MSRQGLWRQVCWRRHCWRRDWRGRLLLLLVLLLVLLRQRRDRLRRWHRPTHHIGICPVHRFHLQQMSPCQHSLHIVVHYAATPKQRHLNSAQAAGSCRGTWAALCADHSIDAILCMAAGDIGGTSLLPIAWNGTGSDPVLDMELCVHGNTELLRCNHDAELACI